MIDYLLAIRLLFRHDIRCVKSSVEWIPYDYDLTSANRFSTLEFYLNQQLTSEDDVV